MSTSEYCNIVANNVSFFLLNSHYAQDWNGW